MAKARTLDTLNFDAPTADETEEQRRQAEDNEILEAYAPEIEISCRRARMKDAEKYDRLLAVTKKAGINVENIMADTDKKRYFIMEILGYSSLNARNGEKVTTVSAKPSRIGERYRDYINTAKQIQIS